MNAKKNKITQLQEVYKPIEEDLQKVRKVLEAAFNESKNESILRINKFLLKTSGKRLRPALVMLSAKAAAAHRACSATGVTQVANQQLINIASAIELIHSASLIHDDVIDQAVSRHNRPSINSKWGRNVAIALGDYLYSKAFELISSCGNAGILSCISQATRLMCEGELVQVCERNNISLLKEHYLIIVKKKTASLFAASCQSGAAVSGCSSLIQGALKEYGLNLGIAFQITDDCLDLTGSHKDLGKAPGADFKMGELTLPVLNLLSRTKDRSRLIFLIGQADKQAAFGEIKERFIDSKAFFKTKDDISFYVQKAKKSLDRLSESCFKQGLFSLADFISDRIS